MIFVELNESLFRLGNIELYYTFRLYIDNLLIYLLVKTLFMFIVIFMIIKLIMRSNISVLEYFLIKLNLIRMDNLISDQLIDLS